MDTLQLLKQEINQTLDSLHDFAKWKLIVASALAAAALGLTTGGGPHYPLLLLIPYACAYIDLNCYQYLIRITVIARSLRELGEDEVLQLYEAQCEELRKTYKVFDLGLYAEIGASFAISIVALIWPVCFFKGPKSLRVAMVCVGALGLYLIVALWRHYRGRDAAAANGKYTEALQAKIDGRRKAVQTSPPLV